MYVVTQHNKIILGPIDWDASYIAAVLQNDLDLDNRPKVLPSDVFRVPFHILPDVYVRNAVIDVPTYNKKIQKFGGVDWTFDEQNAYANYTVIDKDVDEVKGELKNIVSSKRWDRENSGTSLEIQGITVNVTTSRDQRRVFVDKLIAMQDGDVSSWKFEEQWINLTKADITNIVRAIDRAVQDAFDWENNKINQINNCTSLTELDQLNLDD